MEKKSFSDIHIRKSSKKPEAGRDSVRQKKNYAEQYAFMRLQKNQNFQELKTLYEDANEILDQEELRILEQEPPELPPFPWEILLFALMKDILDAVTGSTVSVILSVLFGIRVWFWLFGKLGYGRKKLIRWAVRRGAIFLTIDSIPGVAAFVPLSTIFVILAHFRETKTVQLLFTVLDSWKSGKLREIARTRQENYNELISVNNQMLDAV